MTDVVFEKAQVLKERIQQTEELMRISQSIITSNIKVNITGFYITGESSYGLPQSKLVPAVKKLAEEYVKELKSEYDRLVKEFERL